MSYANESHPMNRYFLLFAAGCCSLMAIFARADNPAATPPAIVDATSPLVEIRTDFGLADGPAWDGAAMLIVPDVKAKTLFLFAFNKAMGGWQSRLAEPEAISGTCFQLGKLYLANNGRSEIQTLANTGDPVTLAKLDAGGKPNDLVVDRDGNVFATITSQSKVVRIDPQGNVSDVITAIQSPNGIALSPDGRTLYVSLYKSGQIIKAAVHDDKTVAAPEPFAQLVATATGYLADGMCTDRAGNVYCAGAAAIQIWDAAGASLGEITTPQRPINATFGGSDARTLYIATFGGLLSQRMNAYAPLPKPAPEATMPEGVAVEYDVVYGQAGPRQLLLDVYQPKRGATPRPGIVLVHGGGWLNGDRAKFRGLATRLAERGYVVAAIEYRLGHEAKFPAGIQDCNAATRFIRANAERFGIDPERIGAVGGSAGGHLVGLMATAPEVKALQGDAGRGDVRSHLRAAVVMAGPMEIATGSVAERSHDRAEQSNAIQWLGKTIDEAPELYHLADAHEKLSAGDPPIMFIRGSLDNPPADLPTIAKMKLLGITAEQVIHEGAKHGHWNQHDWIDQVSDDIDRFLKKNL